MTDVTRRLSALLAIMSAACGGTGPSEPIELEGERTYSYTAFSEDGDFLLTGTIVLYPYDPRLDFEQEIHGYWSIAWVDGADTTTVVGPQVGNGNLRGRATEDGILLDLNYGAADDNVFLAGIVRNNEIEGEWSYATIAGQVARGEFTADD